jgi:alpha-glucosidase (family GH31 glycosyl hydrolase)
MQQIKIKIWFKILLTLWLLTCTTNIVVHAQHTENFTQQLKLLPGEVWWGAIVNKGNEMPFGKRNFTFNLYGDDDGNQAAPLLISNKGRQIWSENPFNFTFKNDSLTIESKYNNLQIEHSGSNLKEAYLNASKKYFLPKGTWPDSLLITAPQYNLWIELMYNPNQKDVLDYANKVLKNGLPPGVLMIDDNWTNYYGQFEFDKEKFPDAKGMIKQLHSMGFKVMLWICPFISPDSEPFRMLSSTKKLLLDNDGNAMALYEDITKPLLIDWWNGYSACLDLTNPSSVEWIQKKLYLLQNNYGVDGFKFDGGDAHFYNTSKLVAYENKNPNEQTYAWAKLGLNFPLNEYRAMWKMGGQPLVLRLRDKAHNWADLNTLIPGTIAQQLLGYTFTCPDMIGGGDFGTFLGNTKIDQKLIVRSAQCSALMPMMQFSVAPWRILDTTHLSAVKQAVQLRQKYLPILMQVLKDAAISGEPALRALEYDYPNQGFENVKDEFLIGNKLLVAPVVTNNDRKIVLFPIGKWRYNNEIIIGPITKVYQVALNELLIFEKL